MITLRREIQLKEGVKVETLFTPHLFSYKDVKGLALETGDNPVQVMETYADLYYLAAINAWELDGKGTVEDFPFTRGDFHEYAAINPRVFGKDVDFAVMALTGKSAKELVIEKEKVENSATSEAPESKKKAFRWIGRLLKRSS
jgi:hypothetical protein